LGRRWRGVAVDVKPPRGASEVHLPDGRFERAVKALKEAGFSVEVSLDEHLLGGGIVAVSLRAEKAFGQPGAGPRILVTASTYTKKWDVLVGYKPDPNAAYKWVRVAGLKNPSPRKLLESVAWAEDYLYSVIRRPEEMLERKRAWEEVAGALKGLKFREGHVSLSKRVGGLTITVNCQMWMDGTAPGCAATIEWVPAEKGALLELAKALEDLARKLSRMGGRGQALG